MNIKRLTIGFFSQTNNMVQNLIFITIPVSKRRFVQFIQFKIIL